MNALGLNQDHRNLNLETSLEATRAHTEQLIRALSPLARKSPSMQLLQRALHNLELDLSILGLMESRSLAAHAVELSELLATSRIAQISQPAYKASSRLAAVVLMWSQFPISETDRHAEFVVATQRALAEVAAQTLLLEISNDTAERQRAAVLASVAS